MLQISLPLEERRNATKLYNVMTIQELQQKFPSIPWREYLANMLTDQIPLLENERIIVDVPSYVSSLEQILAHTPKRWESEHYLTPALDHLVMFILIS